MKNLARAIILQAAYLRHHELAATPDTELRRFTWMDHSLVHVEEFWATFRTLGVNRRTEVERHR